MESKFYSLTPLYGFIFDKKAPQIVLNEIKVVVDKLLETKFKEASKHNTYLAGEIEHEYRFTVGNELEKYIQQMAIKYEDKTQHVRETINSKVRLDTREAWINFQQKHEYNPIHNHGGVFSWVLWYKIPFMFDGEERIQHKAPLDSTNSKHGDFAFHYPTLVRGEIKITNMPLKMDNRGEGAFALFPSNLKHSVLPFYSSDEYRITVAGNVVAIK